MSQNSQIIEALDNGETITALDALLRFDCLRLAARIKELRRTRPEIETISIKQNGKTFGGYRIEKKMRTAA